MICFRKASVKRIAARIMLTVVLATAITLTASCEGKPVDNGNTDVTTAVEPAETSPMITREQGQTPDFTALNEINPDIIAWLYIEGTDIDFPILQNADDNSFYLFHAADQSDNNNGALFTENYNATDFSDYMTAIYGRTPDDGTLFADLLSYRDRVFFDANRTVTVYTPTQTFTYTVFAAYIWDNRHLLLNYDFADYDMRKIYIEYVYNLSGLNVITDDTVTVTADNKILTMCCGTGNDDERFLVQAVLNENQGA